MTSWFVKLVHAVAKEYMTTEHDEACVAKVASFVCEQYDRMPDYLRVSIGLIAVVFNLCPIFWTANAFTSCPETEQRRYIGWWQHSPLGVHRDFVRFLHTLIEFGWQSQRYEQSLEMNR